MRDGDRPLFGGRLGMLLVSAALLVLISGVSRLFVVCVCPHEQIRVELIHAAGHCGPGHHHASGQGVEHERSSLTNNVGEDLCTDLPLRIECRNESSSSVQPGAQRPSCDGPDATIVVAPSPRLEPTPLESAGPLTHWSPPRPDARTRMRRMVELLL